VSDSAQTYGYCERHGNSYAGAPCVECVAEQQQRFNVRPEVAASIERNLSENADLWQALATFDGPTEIPAPIHLASLIHELREHIGTMQARQADQDNEIAALRRRVNRQEQDNADRQRSHNLLVETVDSNGRQIDMLEQQARRRDTEISALKLNFSSLDDRVAQAEDDS
jgi:hypothetical protein